MSLRVKFKVYRMFYKPLHSLTSFLLLTLFSTLLFLPLLFQLYPHSSGNNPDILLPQELLYALPSAEYAFYPIPTRLSLLCNTVLFCFVSFRFVNVAFSEKVTEKAFQTFLFKITASFYAAFYLLLSSTNHTTY